MNLFVEGAGIVNAKGKIRPPAAPSAERERDEGNVNESLVRQEDLYLFNRGELFEAYRVFGAHPMRFRGRDGVRFVVWAPHAKQVRIVGAFNGWDGSAHPCERIGTTGVWAAFLPGLGEGEVYKLELIHPSGKRQLKADPFAFRGEYRPRTASIVARLDGFRWSDERWLSRRKQARSYREPMLIYEVHLGSWKCKGREWFYRYDELATELVDYVARLGCTHLELLPLAEHPLDASWGYQATGFYAATSRYGTPKQLMTLVDRAHRRGLGVILDWVPGHFCKDDHGLRLFDGEPLYEPADSRLAEKPLWGTLAFDFGKSEVQSFLISNARFWMDVYHIDGLRVDAVASMLDRNFDKPEAWHTYNPDGGSEHREAVRFLRRLNEIVFEREPGALMMAEDSSAYPLVTAPTDVGGLGFNYKWNMGWMNDTLRYMKLPPDERKASPELLTFAMMYAYSEQFVLPLSHDEVVHGKRSLLGKMPGDYRDQFASLRLLLAFMLGHPGKKLLFMGAELASFDEWKDAWQLDWELLDYEMHLGFHRFFHTIARLYRREAALWERDFEPGGFEWIDPDHSRQAVFTFVRNGAKNARPLLFVCNFSSQFYRYYRVGVPEEGTYRILFSSDASAYGGSGLPKPETSFPAEPIPWQNRSFSIGLPLPRLTCVILTEEESPCSIKNASPCC